MPRRELNRRTKEERFLDTAPSALATTGHSSTSKGDIATRAGVLKPTLDQSLGSRAQVCCAMMARAAICAQRRIDPAKLPDAIGAGEGNEPANQLVLPKNILCMLALWQSRSVPFLPLRTEDADSQSILVHASLEDNPVSRSSLTPAGATAARRVFALSLAVCRNTPARCRGSVCRR